MPVGPNRWGAFCGGARAPPQPGPVHQRRCRLTLHHREVDDHVIESHDALCTLTLDGGLTLKFKPSSTKNAFAASRSVTTMPTLSKS